MPTNPELRKFIVAHFSDADLDLLIADYFEPYQVLERRNLAIASRAQDLIGYCKRTGQIASLEAALQTTRPKLYIEALGALDVAPVVSLARDPQKCFISHASKDAVFAQQLGLELRNAGAPVWIAPESIKPGEIWMQAIERGLKECGVFVCVLTPDALESEWVKSETEIAIALAKSGEMRIFVLLVQACQASELSIWLTRYQHIQFIDRYASGLNELRAALGYVAPTPTSIVASPVASLPRKPAPRPPKRSRPAKRDTSAAALNVEDMPMCYVPPGEFIMGGDRYDDEKPEHAKKVGQGFWIGKYTVTNAQFKLFVDARGYKKQEFWTEAIAATRWKEGRFRRRDDTWSEGPRQYPEPFSLPNHPVVGVSWYEALAFTRWLQERLGIDSFGLPSEVQWEYAARGPHFAPKAMTPLLRATNAIGNVSAATLADFASEIKRGATSDKNRRIYPWGDAADPKKMNFDKKGIGATSPVGAFPSGVSLFGCEDMSGNVWEWTMTKKTGDYKDYDKKVDTRPDASEASRVLRGGSFNLIGHYARCAVRGVNGPDLGGSSIGFRVVASPIHL